MNAHKDLLERLNDLLGRVAGAREYLAVANSSVADAIARVRRQHQEWVSTAENAVAMRTQDVESFLKQNRKALFAAADRVDVENGAAVRLLESKVVHARCVTPEALEGLGLASAVRVAKSVDWDQVEKWPDERLVAIGTERKTKERIEWETK